MKTTISIFCIIVLSITSAQCQLTAFDKHFTVAQTQQWILRNLDYIIVEEATSHKKPSFSFADTAFIVKSANQHLGNANLSINLIFPYRTIFVMNTYLMDRDGSNKEELIEISCDDLSVDLVVNPTRLHADKKAAFVQDLTNAFYILAGKRDLIY